MRPHARFADRAAAARCSHLATGSRPKRARVDAGSRRSHPGRRSSAGDGPSYGSVSCLRSASRRSSRSRRAAKVLLSCATRASDSSTSRRTRSMSPRFTGPRASALGVAPHGRSSRQLLVVEGQDNAPCRRPGRRFRTPGLMSTPATSGILPSLGQRSPRRAGQSSSAHTRSPSRPRRDRSAARVPPRRSRRDRVGSHLRQSL